MKKRLLATALCASMVLSSSVALAADTTTTPTGTGNNTGAGTNEGLVDTEIYSVTLPTTGTNAYDFYLDPQSNIEDTTGKRYSGFTPTNTTNAYFKTTSSTLTSKSASASVINASYHDLDVIVKVEVTGNTAISIEELGDSGKITNTTPTMFMGLESEVRVDNSGTLQTAGNGTKDTSYVPSSGTLEKKFTLTGDSADYEKSWNASGSKYEMANKGASGSHADSQLDFNLVVGCNTVDDADWTGDAATEAPTVKVTWSYAKHVDKAAPSIAIKNYTLAQDTDVVVNVDLGAGDLAATGIDSLTYKTGSGALKTIDESNYSFADGKLTIKQNFLNNMWISAGVTSKDVTVTFNDTASTAVIINLAATE